MAIKLRNTCRKLLDDFIARHDELCHDLQLNKAAELYEETVSDFLDVIPETSTKLPYGLTDKKIQALSDHLRHKFSNHSKDSVALALHRVLLICKEHGLINGRVMITQRVRKEELPIHRSDAFALMDDFTSVRAWLHDRIQRVPRDRKDLPELVVASLISLNGVLLHAAHIKIGGCRKSMLSVNHNMQLLSVPISNLRSKSPPMIQYPLIPELRRCMEKLKSHEEWIFPFGWTPVASGGRKRSTKWMNQWLQEIWKKVHGSVSIPPDDWNIGTFIMCSRIHSALHVPPIVVGYLCNRSNFASLMEKDEDCDDEIIPPKNASVYRHAEQNQRLTEVHTNSESLRFANTIIDGVRRVLLCYHRKRQNPNAKRDAAMQILAVSCAYQSHLETIPSLRFLILWLINELNDDGGRRKMGTFQSMWQFIPRIIVNELEHEDPTQLDQNQWQRFAEYIIQENSHRAATKRKIKQHLRSFHEFLCQKHTSLSRLNWRRGELQVAGENTFGLFPTLDEFDKLFVHAGKLADKRRACQVQAALTLAFFGGLRVEEITLIRKMDVGDIDLQIRVWWSKTRKGRRRVPLLLLTPANYLEPVMILYGSTTVSEDLLFTDEKGASLLPEMLGKRVRSLMKKVLPPNRSMTIHSLRHGFASWLLIRYFILVDREILHAKCENGAPLIPNADHPIFSTSELKSVVRVFNGRVGGECYAQDPSSFLSKPEHFSMISRMIGHATRETTAQTYVHSMPWLADYFINRHKNCSESTPNISRGEFIRSPCKT